MLCEDPEEEEQGGRVRRALVLHLQPPDGLPVKPEWTAHGLGAGRRDTSCSSPDGGFSDPTGVTRSCFKLELASCMKKGGSRRLCSHQHETFRQERSERAGQRAMQVSWCRAVFGTTRRRVDD